METNNFYVARDLYVIQLDSLMFPVGTLRAGAISHGLKPPVWSTLEPQLQLRMAVTSQAGQNFFQKCCKGLNINFNSAIFNY